MKTSYDIFLVLRRFQECADLHWAALAPLDARTRGQLVGAEGYLDPVTDTALLVLRFGRDSLERLGAQAIHEMVADSGLPMIVPSRLSASDERTFYLEYLSRYCVYVQRYARENQARSVLVLSLMDLAENIEELPQRPMVEADVEAVPVGQSVPRRTRVRASSSM